MAVLCVDIGGTFIKYGLLSESGKLLSMNTVETPKNLNDFKLLLLLTAIVKGLTALRSAHPQWSFMMKKPFIIARVCRLSTEFQ